MGTEKETLAANYLTNKGYQILHRNFYSRFGEIDLIAKDGNTLVFCEVKYRKDEKVGRPEDAVSSIKLRRMQQTAQYYCIRYKVPDTMPKRFDVISILGNQIRVFQNVTGY